MPIDDKMTESRPVEEIKVAIIGTGDGSRLPERGVATTEGTHVPNITYKVVGPIFAILVRFINVFLTTLSGILAGAMVSDVIPASDFIHLLYKCAGLSVTAAGVSLIKNLITVFGKLEQKYPLMTGSV